MTVVPEASKSCSAKRCRIARCPQRFVAVILSPDRLGHLVGVRSYVAAIVKGRFGSEAEFRFHHLKNFRVFLQHCLKLLAVV
jgi:hypothetical protein